MTFNLQLETLLWRTRSFLQPLVGHTELDLPDTPEKAARPPPKHVDPFSRFGPKAEISHMVGSVYNTEGTRLIGDVLNVCWTHDAIPSCVHIDQIEIKTHISMYQG